MPILAGHWQQQDSRSHHPMQNVGGQVLDSKNFDQDRVLREVTNGLQQRVDIHVVGEQHIRLYLSIDDI